VKRRTSDEYTACYQEQARKAFDAHVIRSRDARSWLCYQPHKDGGWDSIFWFEVIVLAGGALYVHGDISGVHFAHYGKYERPEQVLYWMGNTSDLGYYVAQKASIGMNLGTAGEGVLKTVDDQAWLDEALGHIEDILDAGVTFDREKDLKPEDLEPYKNQLEEWLYDMVISVLDGTDPNEIFADPSNLSSEAYEAGAFDWGKVPSCRLIYAHEALRKLVRLLDAEQAVEAPTEAADVG